MVGGLVLAAGEGRRFGGPKQLATLDGAPLLVHALRAVAALDPVVVVLGARAEEVRGAVPAGVARVVVAPDWAEGQAASLRAGVAALGAVDAVVVVLADQPGITPAAVAAALAARDPARFDAVRAVYGDAPGHPVVLERALLARVPALRGDEGARGLLRGARVRALDLTGLADPRDVDTPEELAALNGALTGEQRGGGRRTPSQ